MSIRPITEGRRTGRAPKRYSEKQRERFKTKFYQRRLYEFALIVPLGGAIFMLRFGESYTEELNMGPLMLALGAGGLILAGALFHWFNWRCPACRNHLGRILSPRKCPQCGVTLSS